MMISSTDTDLGVQVSLTQSPTLDDVPASNATSRDLPTFCGSDTSKTYIVLWKIGRAHV